jgi:6,7-dimethyl-8-ribityllumazine synthase
MTKHVLIVDGRFYEDIADELVSGAEAELKAHNITFDHMSVPGAFEIPSVISMAITSEKYDGYIALGCVIRGETTHYDYVCGQTARALQQLAIECHAAIGNGILTVENKEQAMVRASVAKGNKGKMAANACIAMMGVKEELLGGEEFSEG